MPNLDEEEVFSRRRLWLVVAVLWLQINVAVFVGVQLSRTSTPITDWAGKMIRLLR
jgi:hypothetical protein